MVTYKLNDGNQLLAIGCGTNTFGKENQEYMGNINNDTSSIESAIDVGYRRFDTAISYRNETVVALGIKRSKIERKDIFITSKLPGKEGYIDSREHVIQGIEQSLNALDTKYIDLYLIHHPWDNLEQLLIVWKVFEEYHQKGVLKSIGVSNFNEEQLLYLIENATIVPAVNQIESNPKNPNNEIINFCLEHGIVPEVWGPFHGIEDSHIKTLEEIGEKYQKNWAQVLLRYQLDRNVAIIPKSHNKERQASNLDVFDFCLSYADKIVITELFKN